MRVSLRELLPNLLLSTASVVIFLGGTEGICRLLEGRQPPQVVAPYITPWENWEDGFYTVKSTAVGWPPWEDYNSEGLRDRERTVEKPEGVRRVICLGDSTTLGWGIRPEEAYPRVLEDLLESQGDRVEVLNVALGGWSTRQERIAYERIARKYHPDAVLLGICLNDIPELQNNLTRPPALVAALYRRSALVRRLVRAREREIADVLELFTEKDSPKVKDAFARLFEEVRKLREEARADGTSLAVLVFPFRLQVMPGAPPPTAQQAIGGFCKAEGIPFLDLLPALTEAGPEAYIDYDHFSPMGARVVAERVLSSDVAAPKSAASGGETASRYGAAASGSSVPELLARLEDRDPRQRAAAARALGNLGSAAESAVPNLVRRLDDPEPPIRAGAAWALGQIGPDARSAVPALLLAFKDAGIRWRVADALRAIGPSAFAAVPDLVASLQDPSSNVRWRAAEALGAMGPIASRAAVPGLLGALRDPFENVRLGAVVALGQVGADPAVARPAYVRALSDPDARVRARAARALGRLAPLPPEAMQALTRALQDESDWVRTEAGKALRKGGPAER